MAYFDRQSAANHARARAEHPHRRKAGSRLRRLLLVVSSLAAALMLPATATAAPLDVTPGAGPDVQGILADLGSGGLSLENLLGSGPADPGTPPNPLLLSVRLVPVDSDGPCVAARIGTKLSSGVEIQHLLIDYTDIRAQPVSGEPPEPRPCREIVGQP